jgi:hypothetical protein
LKGNEIYHQTKYSLSNIANIQTSTIIPKFTTAHSLLEDKFSIEISQDKKKTVKLTLGDKICFVKHSSNLVCDTIVRGHLSKRHNGGLESPSVYVLVTDNKFDFYNITEIANTKYQILDRVLENTIVRRFFTIYQLADFLIRDLQKDIKKFKSKMVIITGDFYLRDPQITEQEIDWLYPQMIEAIKKVTNSIVIMFSPINLVGLQNIS